ncbi:MAG: hydrogenase maturation nickel metallochaperone HypA [Gammaproteobacteria bacterium]|nr:hydrogenase maturation nickel metallochaperone HypA [Gammaproteobacteria bacterium]
MHELTICLQLIKLIEKKSKKQRIKKIWIAVGELTGIDPHALQFSFPIAASHSIAKEAVLEIISISGQSYCNICKINNMIKRLFDPCEKCGLFDFKITQGKELRIVKMEIA